MSNVLLGIIGVIMFLGLALAGALFLGDRFTGSKTEAEAARFLSEGSQISKAYEMYAIQEGAYANGDPTKYAGETENKRILAQLKDTGYLKHIPEGGALNTANTADAWYIDSTRGAALTLIGDNDGSKKICMAARKQAGFEGDPKSCDASDIANNDPCCVMAS